MFYDSNNQGVVIASKVNPKAADNPLISVMQDYLEAIYNLDSATRMDVKMPTVTR